MGVGSGEQCPRAAEGGQPRVGGLSVAVCWVGVQIPSHWHWVEGPVLPGPCREDFYKLVRGLTITKGLKGANTTFDIYTESWARDTSQETKKKTVVDFETDILFLVPTKIAVAQHRANAK